MIPTREHIRRNCIWSGVLAVVAAGAAAAVAWLFAPGVVALAALCAACVGFGALAYVVGTRRWRRRPRVIARQFPEQWKHLLEQRVAFYGRLSPPERDRFEKMTAIFLDETRITGVGCELDRECLLLVAASAVIPVFAFPAFEYDMLGEVLVYPRHFDATFGIGGRSAEALGMVGDTGGAFNGVMVLSKPDLLHGFKIHGDKHDVGIHEFAHLVDKADGAIDGVPAGMPAESLRAWMQLVQDELGRAGRRSDIPAYGFTSEVEFLAVVTEYFFESPGVMARKHPELYGLLKKVFRQDTRKRFGGLGRLIMRRRRVGRNARCPCGSGEKYKKCCLRKRQTATAVNGNW